MSTNDFAVTFHHHLGTASLDSPLGTPSPGALETSVLGLCDTAHSLGQQPPPVPPTRVGPFRIESRIAEGAEGIIYRAVDERLGRTVAVKVLHSRFASSSVARKRFLEEAKLAASIESDHVVRILEVGGEESPVAYLAMELVEGSPLSDLVRQQGPLPPRQAVELVRQAAIGLAAVHARQLIHRDIKSANLLFDAKTGRVKLADFGLAKILEDEMPLTADNFLTGTPAYMSPEQITSPTAVDARSDIYALGVVLYELLTAQTPYQGSVRIVLTRILHEQPAIPSQYNDLSSASLDAICLKAMSKSPSARYASAQEMADALQWWLRGDVVVAATVVPPAAIVAPSGFKWGKWLLWGAVAGMAAMMLLVALAIGSIVLIAAIGSAAKDNNVESAATAVETDSATDSAAVVESTASENGIEATTAEPKPSLDGNVAQVEAKIEPFAELTSIQQSADVAYEKEDYVKATKLYDELRTGAEQRLKQASATPAERCRLAELQYEGEYGVFWGLRRQAKLSEAHGHGEIAETLAASLLKEQASPEQFQRLLAIQSSIYSLEYEQKNWASATVVASRSLEVARQYLAADPANSDAIEQLADRLVELGDSEYERNRFAAAEKAYAEAVEFVSKQGEDVSDDLTTTLVEAELGLADCQQQQGREAEATPVIARVKRRVSEFAKRDDFQKENEDWLKRQKEWLDELTK